MTFPFDPNRDPNRSLERKAPEVKNRRLPEHFRQAVCAFSVHFLPLSDACHEAANFLRGCLLHARRDVRVHVQ